MSAKLKVVAEKANDMEEMSAVGDPLEMLKQDHDHVKENFEKFEKASESEKYEIFVDTVLSLVVHTKVEEELVYPLLDEGDEEDEDLKLEAAEEHRVVDFVITEMKDMDESDEKFEAKFTVLSELVKHHIKEEEEEMFPALRELEIDFADLAEKMMELKMELQETYSDLDAVEPLQSPAMQKGAPKKKPAAKKSNSRASAAKKSSKSKSTASKTNSKTGSKKSKTTSKTAGRTSSKTSGKTGSKAKSKTASKPRAATTKKSTAKKTGTKTKAASSRAGSKKKTTTAQTKRKKSK